MKLTTAGESHGKALVAILEGLPAHLKIDKNQIRQFCRYLFTETYRKIF